MSQTDYKVQLLLTDEQAKVVMRACELLSRLRIGQLEHVMEEVEEFAFKDMPPPEDDQHNVAFDRAFERVKNSRACISFAKGCIFQDIGGSPGVSYGIGHDRKGDIAWNVYTAIRHEVSWHEHPEGGFGVNFNPKTEYCGSPVELCKIVEE